MSCHSIFTYIYGFIAHFGLNPFPSLLLLPQGILKKWLPFFHLNLLVTVCCCIVLDSEATEDETTEPQMETKEGPGRHQDKAGRKGPSGILLFELILLFHFSFNTF